MPSRKSTPKAATPSTRRQRKPATDSGRPSSKAARGRTRGARPASHRTSGQGIGRLFDDAAFTRRTGEGRIELVPLEQLHVQTNPRRSFSDDGITRLAEMLMCHGQFVPAIGRRVDVDTVSLYAGQRRKLACERSAELAGSPGFEDLQAIGELVVLLLDYEPTDAEIRRLQAQENAREKLTMRDQQDLFAAVWADRATLMEDERLRAVCIDLGISPVKAHNLRRQLTLPEDIRDRVAERPADGQLSVKLANALAGMNQTAPMLARACADRVTTRELHDHAVGDIGSFVTRTVAEDERVYALRLDMVTILDGATEAQRARQYLDDQARDVLCQTFACKPPELDQRLGRLQASAKHHGVTIPVDEVLRSRAANGRYAWVHERRGDLPDGVWVIDPAFTLGIVDEQVEAHDKQRGTDEPGFFQSDENDKQGQQALADDQKRRQADRKAAQAAYTRNVALGNTLKGMLGELGPGQLDAVRHVTVHLLGDVFADLIAYGAGWSDQDHQQPGGERGGYEPRQVPAIVQAEVQRALSDSDPLRGIGQLVTRLCCAFMLDPAGIPLGKALGRKRMERLRERAIPGGDHPVRKAIWELMRPALSEPLVDLHRDAFVSDEGAKTIDLAAYRSDSRLADLDLGEEAAA
jgi:ParB-like chromosome segregation protein Spo0J